MYASQSELVGGASLKTWGASSSGEWEVRKRMIVPQNTVHSTALAMAD
jgi:hypothetical protein